MRFTYEIVYSRVGDRNIIYTMWKSVSATATTPLYNYLNKSIFEDFTFGWIADEIAPHLPKELDFTREGRNAERAAAHIAESGLDCVVPKVLWKKTAARVLTMEFEEGFKATDLDAIQNSGLNKPH